MSNNSVFTMRLKDVIRVLHADVETGVNLGLDTYPIFDESYRAGLNRKIVNHYWNREIGRESIDDWRFALRRQMFEQMPYFNQLYESTRIKFDPLATMDLRTVSQDETQGTLSSQGESDNQASSNATGIGVNNTYPQTSMKDNDHANYADSGNETKSESSSKGSAQDRRNDATTGKSNGDTRSTGFTAPASDLLMRYRDTLLNVDLMVIDICNPLFMNVWDNGDTYTERGFVL